MHEPYLVEFCILALPMLLVAPEICLPRLSSFERLTQLTELLLQGCLVCCSTLCLTTEACCLLSCLFLQAVHLLLQLLVGLQGGHTVIGVQQRMLVVSISCAVVARLGATPGTITRCG